MIYYSNQYTKREDICHHEINGHHELNVMEEQVLSRSLRHMHTRSYAPALPYCKRRKAGRGTGNEASVTSLSYYREASWHQQLWSGFHGEGGQWWSWVCVERMVDIYLTRRLWLSKYWQTLMKERWGMYIRSIVMGGIQHLTNSPD